MYSDTCKFCRGQVWFIREEPQITGFKIENHLGIAKSRPWIIVSCDDSNCVAPHITCVPITTQEKSARCDVFFRNRKKEPQFAIIEKVATKDTWEFEHKGEYMYSVSDAIMQVISTKLSKHLGITLEIPDTSQVEHLIDKIVEAKHEEESIKLIDHNEEFISTLVEKISEKFGVSAKEVHVEDVVKSEENMADESMKIRGSEKHRYYPPELKYQFLADKENLTTDELQTKYGLPSKTIVYGMYSRFKKWAESQEK